jgi:tetratricopeptide (TPR) repeat protein
LSINKRKILQSAQKHLQKGALDKALKDYQTLLEADPKDVNLRLKVGDLHLRLGKSDEAVTAYLKVADRFMKDGFDAKAVALYKQITRIDSKRVDVYVPLAELYQRLGLTSDAMGALQTAADAQYRDGNKPAALELLRKMAGLDPSNTTSRLKVAELLRQEGMKDEALAEFGAVADELERQGEVEGRASVLAKMVELDPTHTSALERLGRCMLAMRKWSQASEIAQRLVEHGSESNVEGYEILAEACPGLNREHELPELYRKLAQALRERGEEDRAREIAQRFTSGTVAASATDAVLFGGEDRDSVNAAIGGTGSFGAETFEDSGFVTDGGLRAPSRERDGIDGRLRATAATPFAPPPLPPVTPVETAGPEPAAAADASDSDATPAPDPDQLLAEATVYVRYGKHERAIESLRALLGRDPDHRKALEKLAEAAAATGQVESAVEAWQRAAEVARAEGDDSGFAALRERLEALDPAAAAALDEAPAEDATDATDTGDAEEIELSLDRELPPAEDDGLEIEIDELDVSDVGDALAGGGDGLSLELGPAVGADASEGDLSFGEPLQGPPERRLELDEASDASDAAPSAEPDAAGSAEGELEFEIDVDLSDGAPADGSDAVAGSDTSDGALAADASEDLELSDDASGPDLSDDEASAHDAGAADEALAETSAPASTSARAAAIGEELETAAFFLAQGMLDEAEDLCRKILDSAPNHPQALLRLGEVEAARAAELAAADAPDAEASEAELTDATADDDTTGEIATPVAPPPPSAAAPTEAPAAPSLPEAEPPVSAEAAPAAACATAPAPAPAPLEADATEPVAEHADGSVDLDLSEEEAEEAPAAIDEAPAAVAAATEEGDFDLAAELSDVGSDASPMSALGAEGTEEEGFRQVFAAFKAGVEKQLGAQDYEARYDLGIAYREMGLLDDAVGEFRTALDGPSHKLQCLHMLGLCALDLGRTADAVAHLEQALAWPELPAEQQTALRFDLGRAFEAAGDRARARAAWEAVVAADPGFADAAERLAGLDAPDDDASGDEGETAEAFESFDDLLEEDAAAAAGARPEPAHESFESFDDLMESDEEDAEASRDERGADETAVAEITASDAALAEEEPFEADPTDEPDPEPAPPPAREEREPPKGGKGGRRKKISFV